MNNDQIQEVDDNKIHIIKKLFVWIIVFFISIMLILLLIIQPRFFTFMN
jgi:hypothetical protein